MNKLAIRKYVTFQSEEVLTTIHEYRDAMVIELAWAKMDIHREAYVVSFRHDGIEFAGFWYKDECIHQLEPANGGCWFCRWWDADLIYTSEFDTLYHRECLNRASPDDREANIIRGSQ